MNFEGFTPHEFDRWSSLVEQDDPTALPQGVAGIARNVSFRLNSVRTRDGVTWQFQTPGANQPITGLASLINQSATAASTQVPLVFDMGGNLYIESPAGSGTLKPATSPQVTPPSNAHLQVAPAYNRGYLAFSDMKVALANPAVYDLPSGNLDPYTMRPVGDRWAANTAYMVGEVITPSTGTTGNGHTYRCTTAGISGASQPAFPTGTGAIVTDGTVTWTENTATMSSSGTTGNICTGQRYMVVLFKNRNGYITGMTEASVQGLNVTSSAQQLTVTNIPLGPAPSTAARVLCFTVSGGTTVGDYFYIPSQDSVSGIPMTSTVINDNTSTSATFNFTDVYLLSTTKVTSFFRKIQAPPCVDIYFSASLNRMILTNPTGHLVSLAADPESFYGDTSPVQPGQLDGQNTICWRDYAGASYSLKERSGYIVEPSESDPSTWQTVKKWEGVGPCGPRAAAVCNAFLCFAHRSGFYVFFGDAPQRVSKEIGHLATSTWRRINWDYQHLIWVHIDEEAQEIRIGIPLDDSTVPSAVLKVNYEESPTFSPPLFFSHFVGKEISSAEARKWSVDDIAAYVCARVERKLASQASGARATMSGADALTRQSQIMFGSSNPDGVVSAIDYGTYSDTGPNGSVGIDSVYEAVAPAELMRVNQLGGMSVNAVGNGDLLVSIILGRQLAPDKSNKIDLVPIRLDDSATRPPKSVGGRGQNERMHPRFSNGKQPGAWFDIKYAVLYARPIAAAR
jgi:hypothetical protein